VTTTAPVTDVVVQVERPDRTLQVIAVGAVLAALLPLVLGPAQESVAIRVLIFALLGTGWNVMSGLGGMFSFGHAAYFGLGAYTAGYLLVEHDVSPWIGMVVGAALAALFGVVTGFLALRYKLRGAYFALATLAFAEMLRLLFLNLDLTNKAIGLNVPLVQGSSWWKLQFPAGSSNYYWVGLALTVLALVCVVLFMRSRTGQYALAVRDDEQAAASLGVDVMRIKLTTIALSAAITAVAGTFYLQYYLFVNPDLVFGNTVSIQAILPAVVGGVGTVLGPVVGALVLGPLADLSAGLLRNPPPGLEFLQGRAGLDIMIYAALLILIILVLPKGLYGSAREWRRRHR
jgi:branched-chain amino acid transport system permease protein